MHIAALRTLVSLNLILLLPSTTLALIEPAVIHDDYPMVNASQSSHLTAQVVFDGEGEAAVALNLKINEVQDDTSQVVVTIPGAGVRIRRALQEYTVEETEDYCAQQGSWDYQSQSYPCHKTAQRTNQRTMVEVAKTTSEQASDGQKVTIILPAAIKKGESTNIALAYKVTGYVQDGFVSRFEFPTPKVQYDLDTVSVRIDVADTLILKGGKAATDYNQSLAEGIATAVPASFNSGLGVQFDQYVSESSAYTKTTKALDPGESFTVAGVYAESWLGIYWPQVILMIIAFMLLVGLIVWGERRAARTSVQS